MEDSEGKVGRPDILQILEKSEDEQNMVLILEQFTSREATVKFHYLNRLFQKLHKCACMLSHILLSMTPHTA